MEQQPRHLRIFLSSPGDVADERGIAQHVIDGVQYDPFLRDRVTFDIVAWDKPGAGTPMLATVTPQAAIDAGLPKPSECDIVVVLLWARMGTPLPHSDYQKLNGEPYYSGTEWEFEDAMRSAREQGRPDVMVYRRVEKVLLDDDAPDFEDRLKQKRCVNAFFARFRDPDTGVILQGYNEYKTPDDFRQKFELHLKALVKKVLESSPNATPRIREKAADIPSLWQSSPFPGLRAFTSRDAPIFFGRGRETDELIRQIANSRFVAVVGASGSGKSSLVAAGAIPRLADGALSDSVGLLLPLYNNNTGQWEGLRFTPGEVSENPFMALALKLAPLVTGVARDIATELLRSPAEIAAYCSQTLRDRAGVVEVLIFVDQFEELFTLVSTVYRQAFVALLEFAAQSSNIRTVITMRSDFYSRCIDLPALARLLELGQFPLSAPTDTLLEMITRPAERAGLRFEEGLPGRILSDTGQEPGALPLLAYTLDELYHVCKEKGVLGHVAYDALGGVQGAIGTRAEDIYEHKLDDNTRAAFAQVFRALVDVNEQGQLTRRRVALNTAARDDESSQRFVEVFTTARLFVQSRAIGHDEPVVEVAHEALFRTWERLRTWIETVQDDLRLLRKANAAANDWNEHGRDETYLWAHERLEPVYGMLERLRPALDEVTSLFIRPEYERLFVIFNDPETEEYHRQVTSDRLVAIGDVTIPGLLAALRNKNSSVRAAAMSALTRLGLRAISGLLEAITDPDPATRLHAAGALRIIGDQQGVPGLLTALRDTDMRVRSIAVGALETIGGEAALQGLTETLRDSDMDLRWRAAGTLGAFGTAAVPGLLTALRDENLQVRGTALDAFKVIGETAVSRLLEALHHVDANVRWSAAEALVAVGAVAVPRLSAALTDTDADVRWRAAEILLAIGDADAVPGLLRALNDPDVAIRRTAADALRIISDETAVSGLLEALHDEDVDVRWTAGEALSALGEPAIPGLLATLRKPEKTNVAAIAATALGQIGETAVPSLLEAIYDLDTNVRLRAADALAEIGQPALPGLLNILYEADSTVLSITAGTLIAIGEPIVSDLLERLDDPNINVRLAIIQALSGIRKQYPWLTATASISSALFQVLLKDPDANVQVAAAEGLEGDTLLQALHEGNQSVRLAASKALTKIGGKVVPGLLDELHNRDADIRAMVAETLNNIATLMALIGLANQQRKYEADDA